MWKSFFSYLSTCYTEELPIQSKVKSIWFLDTTVAELNTLCVLCVFSLSCFRLLTKLSRIVKCKKTLTLISNMLSEINDKIRRKFIMNDSLQGSVLSFYTSHIPNTISRTIAIAAQAKTFEDLEKVLGADLQKMSFYFAKWSLKPNASKTTSTTFHLNNHQVSRKLKLKLNGRKYKHDKYARCPGVIHLIKVRPSGQHSKTYWNDPGMFSENCNHYNTSDYLVSC